MQELSDVLDTKDKIKAGNHDAAERAKQGDRERSPTKQKKEAADIPPVKRSKKLDNRSKDKSKSVGACGFGRLIGGCSVNFGF